MERATQDGSGRVIAPLVRQDGTGSLAPTLRLIVSTVADGAGLLLLAVLGWWVMFGGRHPFENHALLVGVIGALACWTNPGASRHVPRAMLAYVGVGLLAAVVHRRVLIPAHGPDVALLLDPVRHLIVMAIFVYAVAHLLRTPRRLAVFAVFFVGAVLVLTMHMTFDRVRLGMDRNPFLPSVSQWWGYPQVGLLILLATPFPLALAAVSRSGQPVMAGALLTAGLLGAAYINGSRTGFLITALMVVGMVPLAVRDWRATGWRTRGGLLLLLGATSTLGYGVMTGTGPLAGILPLVVAPVEYGFGQGRLLIWRAAGEVFAQHFWTGVGPGNYSIAIQQVDLASQFPWFGDRPVGQDQAHNTLLHVGVELGIFGAIALAAFWWSMLRGCWKAYAGGHARVLGLGLVFALGGFILRSMSDHFLDNLATTSRTRVLIWTLFAAAVAAGRLPGTPVARPRSDR